MPMKHGILAHHQLNGESNVMLYTFAAPAVYRLFVDGTVMPQINEKPLLQPTEKHLANTGDVISISGSGTALLEGIEQ